VRTRYVNTASTVGTQDGTTTTAGNSGTAAFATWDQFLDWLVANDATLSDSYTLEMFGSTDDTTDVVINGLTMGANTMLCRGYRSDAAGFNDDDNSLISTGHYTHVSSARNVDINEQNVTIDGAQFENSTGTAFRSCIKFSNTTGTVARNNRCRNTGSTRTAIGHEGGAISGSGTLTIENNIVSGFDTSGVELISAAFATPTYNVMRNAVYGKAGGGTGVNITRGSSFGGTINVKANAIGNCGTDITVGGSGGTVNFDSNATEDVNGHTNEIAIGTLTDAWASPGTAQASDFSIKDTSSSLYDSSLATGLPANDCKDIAYVTDDVGPYAFPGGGGGSIPKHLLMIGCG